VDRIVIKDLEVEAHIGVTESERGRTQPLLITVELERDLAEAGRTDRESFTMPYDMVVDMIRKVVTERPHRLVETVAHRIAEAILFYNMALAVTVEVKKFSIPRSQYVSVQIRRPR
jgi:dihydroneopterin aldolase